MYLPAYKASVLLLVAPIALGENATYKECVDSACSINCTAGSYTPIGQWPIGKCFAYDSEAWQLLRKCCGGDCYVEFHESPMCDESPDRTELIPVDACKKRTVVERYWDPRGFFQERTIHRYVQMEYADASAPCPTPAPPLPRPVTFHTLHDVTVQPAVELKHLNVQNVDECRTACLSHRNVRDNLDCVAFTVLNNGTSCSLKYATTPMVELKGAATYILGNWTSPSPPVQCGSDGADCGVTPCCPGATCATRGGRGVQFQYCRTDTAEVVV